MPDSFGDAEVGSAVQPCPLRKNPQHWIEIKLIGEDDQPIPGIEYVLTLPDGSTVRGYLDDAGSARLDGLESGGSCKVGFPAFDKDAWYRRGEEPKKSKST